MIARSYILKNLRRLDSHYRKSVSQKDSLFYSKLAILELCGWIEQSMDDIILRCACRHLKESKNKIFVEKHIVERNYGFQYDKHFRQMLVQLIGVINVEIVERSVDDFKMQRLKSELGNLKTIRNKEAHTHIKKTTRSIDAPSVTLNRFPALYEGLVEIQEQLKKIKLYKASL